MTERRLEEPPLRNLQEVLVNSTLSQFEQAIQSQQQNLLNSITKISHTQQKNLIDAMDEIAYIHQKNILNSIQKMAHSQQQPFTKVIEDIVYIQQNDLINAMLPVFEDIAQTHQQTLMSAVSAGISISPNPTSTVRSPARSDSTRSPTETIHYPIEGTSSYSSITGLKNDQQTLEIQHKSFISAVKIGRIISEKQTNLSEEEKNLFAFVVGGIVAFGPAFFLFGPVGAVSIGGVAGEVTKGGYKAVKARKERQNDDS